METHNNLLSISFIPKSIDLPTPSTDPWHLAIDNPEDPNTPTRTARDETDPIFSCIQQQANPITTNIQPTSTLELFNASAATSEYNEQGEISYNHLDSFSFGHLNTMYMQKRIEDIKSFIEQNVSSPAYATREPIAIFDTCKADKLCKILDGMERINPDRLNPDVMKIITLMKRHIESGQPRTKLHHGLVAPYMPVLKALLNMVTAFRLVYTTTKSYDYFLKYCAADLTLPTINNGCEDPLIDSVINYVGAPSIKELACFLRTEAQEIPLSGFALPVPYHRTVFMILYKIVQDAQSIPSALITPQIIQAANRLIFLSLFYPEDMNHLETILEIICNAGKIFIPRKHIEINTDDIIPFKDFIAASFPLHMIGKWRIEIGMQLNQTQPQHILLIKTAVREHIASFLAMFFNIPSQLRNNIIPIHSQEYADMRSIEFLFKTAASYESIHEAPIASAKLHSLYNVINALVLSIEDDDELSFPLEATPPKTPPDLITLSDMLGHNELIWLYEFIILHSNKEFFTLPIPMFFLAKALVNNTPRKDLVATISSRKKWKPTTNISRHVISSSEIGILMDLITNLLS